MTQEQIETKCQDYSKSATPSFVNGTFERYAIAQAFEDGANWRINSVWHSAQDMPSRNMRDGGVGELCLVETSDGDIEFVQACYESINGVYYFKAYFGALELFKITRWAYVKDLMPIE